MSNKKFSDLLLNWYDQNRRHLPWRYAPGKEANPYYVWISEIMLQQTGVSTVIPYFEKFIKNWPTLESLAQANIEEILVCWQGLGYYSRAQNLHKCAKALVQEHNSTWPKSAPELKKLPGIGPYTSAAISAIAFQHPETVVDGNVDRIISRIEAFKKPIRLNKSTIYTSAQKLTPQLRAGDYAQAMMDLGSQICTNTSPKCDMCPVQQHCQGFASGNPTLYPGKPYKKPTPFRKTVVIVIEKEDKILVRKRSKEGMLANMLELPSTPWNDKIIEGISFSRTHDIRHTFSHFHLHVEITTTLRPFSFFNGTEFWCKKDTLHQHPISTLTKKILAFL